MGKDRKGRERGEWGPLERYEEAMLKPKVGWGRRASWENHRQVVKELEKARELEPSGMRGAGEQARRQNLPYQGLAAAPGRQRTPTSRAWSWPHCGPATGVLEALREMGQVLQETQSLHAVREAHGSLFTFSLPASTLCEVPRSTSETQCWLEGLQQGRWWWWGMQGSGSL